MSLREILEGFIARVEDMKDVDGDGNDAFDREFILLQQMTVEQRTNKTFPAVEGAKECNRKKNRFKDILPFDHSRVKLKEVPGAEGSTYINGNHIKGASGKETYIVTQGPLPTTVNDFWRMIWEKNVRLVIMLCNEIENGKSRCSRYWPGDVNKGEDFDSINVKLVSEEAGTEDVFLLRQMAISRDGDEVRRIYQFHFLQWPDHDVPGKLSLRPLLDMIAQVRELQDKDMPPIVIHCSAGCGRSGTVMCIDYAWNMLKLGKLTEDFNLYEVIAEMRRQRQSIVQAKAQYELANEAVKVLFEQHLELIEMNEYSNWTPPEPSPVSPDNEYDFPKSMACQNEKFLYEPVGFQREGDSDDVPVSPTHRSVRNTVFKLLSESEPFKLSYENVNLESSSDSNNTTKKKKVPTATLR